MKIYWGSIIIILLSNCGKPDTIKKSVAEIENIMLSYAPCHQGWFCYEYEFNLDKKKMTIITRRYNYKDSNQERYLALTTSYKLPVEKINDIKKFPTTDDTIQITTQGNHVELTRDGATEKVDYLILDFNQLVSYDNQLTILINELQRIVNYYQEAP